jgi:hypothetical protein
MATQEAIFELIGLVLTLAVGLAVVSAFTLTFFEVLGWFTVRTSLYHSDADNIAFTLAKHWSSGDYHTVQGVFNTKKSTVVAGRNVHSNDVDDRLESKHQSSRMVVYD